MLSVVTNEYMTSVGKIMHSKLEESRVVGPRTHVEPTNGFSLKADRWHGSFRVSGPSCADICEPVECPGITIWGRIVGKESRRVLASSQTPYSILSTFVQ